jgi:hypothetical protein
MSTLLVAKLFRCDLCNTQAVVDKPDVDKVPDGWGSLDVQLLAHGLRIKDFCGSCAAKPFAQVITEVLGIVNQKMELEAARDGEDY